MAGKTNKDPLDEIYDLQEQSKKALRSMIDDRPEGNSMLKQIQASCESIQRQVEILKKYREIRHTSIWIFDPQNGGYFEANTSQKIKIARDFLLSSGPR